MAMVKTDSEMVAFKNMMIKDSLPTEVIVTGETKKILGYLCKKAIIKRSPIGQKENVSEVWFTPQIRPFYVDPDPAFKKLDGLLMDFRINQDGNIVHIKAKLVMPAPIDDSIFIVPKDYQFVTEAELTRIMNVLMMERQNGR
jgi:GLPGLI family protein